ncbi:MAG: DUF4918 family protein [Cyclobacteriaceae bacterium]|nr:DUF4918 family protein [Cyclobacteriaceae bacterium HetDA_MAG_MS6]
MFSEAILQYYRLLTAPTNLPEDVEVMNPYQNPSTYEIASSFYTKYYKDQNPRLMCFGINPGRFGAGVTGVPFTDPIRLTEICGIENRFDKKAELSSKFIYDMIEAFGGPKRFYNSFYISAISPLGYIRDGINLNYYDIKGFKSIFEQYAIDQIRLQLPLGIDTRAAFSIGMGQNVKFLQYLNDKYRIFDQIIPLPHPRWVMQYRLKSKDVFIQEYIDKLSPFTKGQ